MSNSESNETLTRMGPGAAMGRVFRQFWQPALLSEELPVADCPPVRVRLMGEDFVALRDSSGKVGLLDAHCPHRLADLFFGRNEEGGLRCIYHGWKYDIEGNLTAGASTSWVAIWGRGYPQGKIAPGFAWRFLAKRYFIVTLEPSLLCWLDCWG